ncbi:MAG: hypothetical protein D6732_29385, partial [Methanobacteriota archaeon]
MHRPSIRGVAKYARDIRPNSIKNLLYGNPTTYPAAVRMNSKDSLFITDLGFGRLDALGRDWKRIASGMNVNGELFRIDKIRNGLALTSENAFRLATAEFRKALALRLFGRDYATLKRQERKVVFRMITALAKKFENSIAQHQLIEWMRSGRWVNVEHLGFLHPYNRSAEVMEIVDHVDIAKTGGALEITLPFWIESRIFMLRITPTTLFRTEWVDNQLRFGFTTHLEEGMVKPVPKKYLDLTSVIVKEPLPDGKPTRTSMRMIRELQQKVFRLVFRTDGIGHPSNWIDGSFMPELTILEYGNATTGFLKKMFHSSREYIPKGFDAFKGYSTELFRFTWQNFTGAKEPLKKVIQTSTVNDAFPVSFPQGVQWVKIRRLGKRAPSERNRVLFINRCSHSVKVRSVSKFSSLLFSKRIRKPELLKERFSKMGGEEKIRLFHSFGIGHQSGKTSRATGGGMPSPLEFSTVDPLTGTLIPQNLITLVQVQDEEDDIAYFMFRPPSRYSKKLVSNKELDIPTAQKLLNTFYSLKERVWGLAPHFCELAGYLTEGSVAELVTRHQMPAHMALIRELEQFAAGHQELVKLQFKKEFDHLKVVYVFGGPDFSDNPPPDIFSVSQLRLTYGQFITTPDAIGYKSTNFRFGKQVEIFESPEAYQKYGATYLEALLRRIRSRLTLDADLLEQNLRAWRDAPVETYKNSKNGRISIPFSRVMDLPTIAELAMRQLAPGHTILYEMNGKRRIVRMTDFAFENFVVTPIF